MNKIPRICGIALVIGFFLPFVSIMGVSCSGLDLVKMGSGGNPMGGMMEGMGGKDDSDGGSMGGGPDKPPTWQLQIIALIPLVGLVSAIANKKAVYYVCGAVPVLIFGFYVISSSGDVFKMMGIGAWLCFAAGIAMLSTTSRMPSPAMAMEDGGGGLDPGGGDAGQ